MKYVIEFDLPDNDTVLNNIKTAWVGWNVWGYSGTAHAKPKQPERKKGKWIPVSERLPEEGEYVLCSQINGDVGEGKRLKHGWLIMYESQEYGDYFVEA